MCVPFLMWLFASPLTVLVHAASRVVVSLIILPDCCRAASLAGTCASAASRWQGETYILDAPGNGGEAYRKQIFSWSPS